MASREHTRNGTAASRGAKANHPLLANIAAFIDAGGQITVGALHPIACAAIANDEDTCLAMLKRKPGEMLQQLLERLDTAIDVARTTEQFADEINAPPGKPSR